MLVVECFGKVLVITYYHNIIWIMCVFEVGTAAKKKNTYPLSLYIYLTRILLCFIRLVQSFAPLLAYNQIS